MHHKVEAAAWLGATNGPENVITQPLMSEARGVDCCGQDYGCALSCFVFLCKEVKIIHISCLGFEEMFISTMA